MDRMAGYVSQNSEMQERIKWDQIVVHRNNIADSLNFDFHASNIENLKVKANLTDTGLYFNLMNNSNGYWQQIAHVSFHYMPGGIIGQRGAFHLIDDITRGFVRYIYSFTYEDFFVADKDGIVRPEIIVFGQALFITVRALLKGMDLVVGGKRAYRYKQTLKRKLKKRQTKKH